MKKLIVFLTVILSVPLLLFSVANASLVMTLDNTGTVGTDLTVTDNTAPDLNPAVGAIVLLNPTIGGLSLLTAVAVQTGSSYALNLNNLGGSAGTLVVRLSNTNFANPSLPVELTNTLSYNAIQGGTTILTQGFLDPSNSLFGTAYATPSLTTLGSVSSVTPLINSQFSLTESITIAHPGGISSGFMKNLTATPVPVPGALYLLGSGLLGLIGVKRFRRS